MVSYCGSASWPPVGWCHCQYVAKIAKEIHNGSLAGRSNMSVRAACSQVSSARSWPHNVHRHGRPARTVAASSASSQAHYNPEANCSGFTVFGQDFLVGAMSKPVYMNHNTHTKMGRGRDEEAFGGAAGGGGRGGRGVFDHQACQRMPSQRTFPM